MSDLLNYTRRDGLAITLPDTSRIVVRCTGDDEYVIELDGLPIWANLINLVGLQRKLTACLVGAGYADECTTPESLARSGGAA
jgi:hypothetical protein